jgi:GntR family transcriptional regulator, rspAB operon transcriptional repressor
LAENAYQMLKGAIMRGDFPEGIFLTEADILPRFGIGRTPFREACNRLHNDDFLEVVPHRGYFLPEVSFRRVRDLFEVRLILEGAVAELVAPHAGPAQVEELEHILEQAQALEAAQDTIAQAVTLNTEFHLCLARMTQNRELVRLMTGILEKNERLGNIERRWRRGGVTNFAINHQPILAAIRERDPRATREKVIADITQAQLGTVGWLSGITD